MNKNKFEVNRQANIADIGARINEALFAFDDNDNHSLRDYLLEIHSMIYPNASERTQPQMMNNETPANTEIEATMNKTPLSEIQYLLLEEAAALTTLGKALGLVDGIDSKYESNFQIQDISSIGYLVSQSATRIYDLQEYVGLAFREISEHTLKDVSEPPASTDLNECLGTVEPTPVPLTEMTRADAIDFLENAQPLPSGFFIEALSEAGETTGETSKLFLDKISDNPGLAAQVLFTEFQ